MEMDDPKKAELKKLLSSFPKDQTGALAEFLAEIAATTVMKILPGSLEKALSGGVIQTMQRLGYTDEVAGLVQLLASKSGDNLEAVLKKALNLYGLALDASERGNRMAILNPDDEIVREIIGFEVTEPNAQPVA